MKGPFKRSLYRVGVRYLGWTATEGPENQLIRASGERFVDLVETTAVEGKRTYENVHHVPTQPIPRVEDEMNDLFDRHCFRYRIEDGEMRPIGSPVLDEVVVGPALLATRRKGWDEVERAYREAIRHQRGGADENDDALTAANAAVEAALKAAGFKGANPRAAE